jgi:hypothetical protein
MPETPAQARRPLATAAAARRLPPGLRRPLERFFDAPLDGVRVACDAPAPPGARGWAAGETIGLAAGAPGPATPAGARLLCHELTHVLQQRWGRLPEGVAGVVRDPRLEAEADVVGDAAAAALSGRRPLLAGAGRRMLGLGSEARPAAGRAPVVQLQERGRLNRWVFTLADDGWVPAIEPGTLIFRQTASTNEAYSSRARAIQRAKDRHGWISGNARRTYFSNATHVLGTLGQGNLFRFMHDRDINPVESYGRYYEHPESKLVVEHTDDLNCRLIEIVEASNLTVGFRRWSVIPHFHMATYAGEHYHGSAHVDGDRVQGSPPGYEQAVVNGHHIYHIDPGLPTAPVVQRHPRRAFEDAFNEGNQQLFDLVWPGGW